MLFYKLFLSFKIMEAIKRQKYKTLNLNISASRQSIKNRYETFGAIHMWNMHTKFQPSSSIGVGGVWGDTHMCDVTSRSLHNISKLPLSLCSIRFGRDKHKILSQSVPVRQPWKYCYVPTIFITATACVISIDFFFSKILTLLSRFQLAGQGRARFHCQQHLVVFQGKWWTKFDLKQDYHPSQAPDLCWDCD